MARVITIAAPKGGCCKTTTVQTLAVGFQEAGKKVLCLDTDPQGNLSSVLGYKHRKGVPTFYNVLREWTFNRKKTLPSAIYHLKSGIDLVPANLSLNDANDELAAQVEREHIFEKLVAPVRDQYDIILIDTMPYLGVLVNNALVVTDELIIPIQAEPLGIAAAAQMLKHLQKVRDDGMISRLIIRGGLMTLVDRRTAINVQSIGYAHDMLGDYIPFFPVEIDRSVRVPEGQLERQSILTYHPKGAERVAVAYRSVRDMLLAESIGTPVQTLNIPTDLVEDVLGTLEDEEGEVNA